MEKVVIVTGGSKGIGKSIVEKLAKNGYIVILNYYKSEQEAQNIQNCLKNDGINIDIYKANVSNREEVKEMVDYVINKYSKVDILINNAGVSQTKLFTDISNNDWNNMINTNLNSVYYVTQEVVTNMIKNKNGCIINISSIWGEIGASCESHYAVTKAGIDALTKSLAKELGPSNIRINSVSPGIINTQMNSKLSKEEINEIKEEIPLGCIGEPEDISNCVEWLINAKYVTGQIISVNGGWNI